MTAAPIGALFMGRITVRPWIFVLMMLVVGGTFFACRGASGQETKPAAAPLDEENSSIQEVKPGGFYLRNKRGDLVYVPDFPYERFEELVQVERKLANPKRPAFVIRDMAIEGVVVKGGIELNVEFTIEGRELGGVKDGTWFRVPLRFDKAYLLKEPLYEGQGEHFLNFAGRRDGYVCWLQMAAGTAHKVSVSFWAPMEKSGDKYQFVMATPAPLASSLTLRVPENPAEGLMRDLADDSERPLAFTETDDGMGQFTARGIRGDVLISWSKSRTVEEQTEVRLDVYGTVIVTADEVLQEVRSDGRFVVRGLGGPLESFRVRLPPGMRYRESPEPGYTIRPVTQDRSAQHEGQVVEVRLDRPTGNEAHIRLIAELPVTPDDPSWPLTVAKLVDQSLEFEPARFAFPEAIRHRGRIDFVIKGDWALQWEDDADFPRVDPGTVAGGSASIDARFRYHTQEGSLRVSIRQKATRIGVEPAYKVHVYSRQARLLANLECRTSGSKAGPLAVRLPGWSVEIVRFADVDSPHPIDLNETDPLVIPIPIEAQATGRFTLQIEARQDLSEAVASGTEPFRVVLPLVEAANPSRANLIVSPATVTMVPAENVLLTPRPRDMQALTPLINPYASDAESLPEGSSNGGSLANNGHESTILRYRDRGASEQAVFVGDFKILPQSISASIASVATLDRRSFIVEQRISYTILHEPVRTLAFDVPARLVTDDRVILRLMLDDQPLTPIVAEALDTAQVRIQVRLAQPVLGAVELRIVQARQSIPELNGDQEVQVAIPLVFPATGAADNLTIIGNTLTVLYEEPLSIEPAGSAWTVVDAGSSPGKLVFTSASNETDATLNVSVSGAGIAGSTAIHQAWIQSWIAGSQRRDRAVFRIRTNESQLRILLPRRTAADVKLIKLAIDHHELSVDPTDTGSQVIVPVPASLAESASEHIVEVWYTFTKGRPARGLMTLDAAMIDAVDLAERSYWQLILPRDELVLWGDRNLTPEFMWQWQWMGLTRRPLHEQADLERWIGASTQDPVSPESLRYLFTSLGAPNRLEVTTASRTVVLAMASGVTLIVGLFLLYFPILRHPALLLLAAVVTAAASFVLPDAAMLFAQAACLGVLLAILAGFLRRVLWGPNGHDANTRGRSQYSDSKIMELRYPRADGSSKIAPAPVTVPSSAAEPKP